MGFRETVYREYYSAVWNYWTYLEGRRWSINKRQYDIMIRQGAKEVIVK